MQFNHHTYNDMERETFSARHGDIPEATESELQYLNSTATTLVVVTTWSDMRDHMIVISNMPDDKRQDLLNALSNTDDAFTSVVMYMDGKHYLISDRKTALEWLGLTTRAPARIRDVDMVEYIDAHELTVMS